MQYLITLIKKQKCKTQTKDYISSQQIQKLNHNLMTILIRLVIKTMIRKFLTFSAKLSIRNSGKLAFLFCVRWPLQWCGWFGASQSCLQSVSCWDATPIIQGSVSNLHISEVMYIHVCYFNIESRYGLLFEFKEYHVLLSCFWFISFIFHPWILGNFSNIKN